MALSMTGFGAAESEISGRRLRIEIRTVNHRYFNGSVRLPSDLAGFEPQVRERLKGAIDRGHVTLMATWTESTTAAGRIDWEAAEQAVATLGQLKNRFGLAGEVTLELVARFPDVFANGRDQVSVEWAELEPLVDEAIAACVADRRREGQVIGADVASRIDAIGVAVESLEPLLPTRLERELARLRASTRELLGGVEIAPDRLAAEIALLADRVDVTEEMVRLRAHLDAARQLLASDAPIGKQLGFLAQEIGREVNTIGSKANDATIAHIVVSMKGNLEKVREQLENLE